MAEHCRCNSLCCEIYNWEYPFNPTPWTWCSVQSWHRCLLSSPTWSTTNATTTPSNRHRLAPRHCLCRCCWLCETQLCLSKSGGKHCTNMSETLVPFVNKSKTKRTSMRRETDRVAEVWRVTKKLGSVLGDAEDMARRKQLALLAFRRMWTLWLRWRHVGEAQRLRLYNAFIVPVLTYNMSTWALTQVENAHLDSIHRTQLKHLLGIKWPQCISNKVLYQRCQCEPLSIKITEARWRLFGHVLRMPQNVPAQTVTFNHPLECHAGEDDHRLH